MFKHMQKKQPAYEAFHCFFFWSVSVEKKPLSSFFQNVFVLTELETCPWPLPGPEDTYGKFESTSIKPKHKFIFLNRFALAVLLRHSFVRVDRTNSSICIIPTTKQKPIEIFIACPYQFWRYTSSAPQNIYCFVSANPLPFNSTTIESKQRPKTLGHYNIYKSGSYRIFLCFFLIE